MGDVILGSADAEETWPFLVCSVENNSITRVGNIGVMEISALMWRIVRSIAAYFLTRKTRTVI